MFLKETGNVNKNVPTTTAISTKLTGFSPPNTLNLYDSTPTTAVMMYSRVLTAIPVSVIKIDKYYTQALRGHRLECNKTKKTYFCKKTNYIPAIHGIYRIPMLYFSQCDIWKLINEQQIIVYTLIGDKLYPSIFLAKMLYSVDPESIIAQLSHP